MAAFSCFDKRPLSFRVVDTVRIELGFQSDTAPVTTGYPILAGFTLQEIAAVKLDATAIGIHGHGAARLRVLQYLTGITN